jgi:hypothetical protein
MRKFITSVSICLVCGMMFCPITEGQNRGRNNGNNGGNSHSVTTTQRSQSQPRQSQQTKQGTQRSQNTGGQNVGGQNKNNNVGTIRNNGNVQRPGNMGGMTGGNGSINGNRNGGIRNGGNMDMGNNRPGNGGWNTHNPGNNHVSPRPGGGGSAFGHGAPVRPYMPANRGWFRPSPPAHFRPYRGCPSFSTILGITLGSALDYTLDRLLGRGYNVLGYVADAIYLSNVPMFNYTWPNATLHYTEGALRGSEFTYSTPGYDRSRYISIYNDLVRQYGSPISVQNNGNDNFSATWWGYNNNYVTLSFYQDYAYNGALRYYTTLSFGN